MQLPAENSCGDRIPRSFLAGMPRPLECADYLLRQLALKRRRTKAGHQISSTADGNANNSAQ